jgi:hypothetical protein
MAKSLIKTVDGIGIWVREDTVDRLTVFGWVMTTLLAFLVVLCECASVLTWIWWIPVIICAIAFVIIGVSEMKPHQIYVVYPGTDYGIVIPKTTDPKADQIAICKAAKEIEARCHEIANKRRELDHIAESCK